MEHQISDQPTPLDVVRAFYAGVSGPNLSFDSLLSPDVEWWQTESHPFANPAGPWRGREALLANVSRPLRVHFDNWGSEVEELFGGDDDRVVALGRYVGTHRATGRTVNPRFCIVFRVRQGLIVEARQHVDTAQLRALLDPLRDA